MTIYNKRKLAAALIAVAVAVACLMAYFSASSNRRFIVAFFLSLVYAGLSFCGAFTKAWSSEEWKHCTDERDRWIAMKTSQRALMIFNRLLLCACIISIICYGLLRSPFCLAILVTLCMMSVALMVILLSTNLYYEKHS